MVSKWPKTDPVYGCTYQLPQPLSTALFSPSIYFHLPFSSLFSLPFFSASLSSSLPRLLSFSCFLLPLIPHPSLYHSSLLNSPLFTPSPFPPPSLPPSLPPFLPPSLPPFLPPSPSILCSGCYKSPRRRAKIFSFKLLTRLCMRSGSTPLKNASENWTPPR